MLKKNIFMQLIDTHCHLYLPEFDHDLAGVFERADAAGVKKFFFPEIDNSFMDAMINMEEKFTGKCFLMAGLHPCSVNNNYKYELKIVENYLQRRSFAAIGEIGLDFY